MFTGQIAKTEADIANTRKAITIKAAEGSTEALGDLVTILAEHQAKLSILANAEHLAEAIEEEGMREEDLLAHVQVALLDVVDLVRDGAALATKIRTIRNLGRLAD